MRERLSRISTMVVLLVIPTATLAQVARDSSVDWLVSAGSEGEQYLRAMQDAGLAVGRGLALSPFSIGSGADIILPDSGHPWAGHFTKRAGGTRPWIRPVMPLVQGIYNSRFAYGVNDGPVWAGRGLTSVASLGVQGAVGPIQFVLAPELFRAENSAYPIAPNGLSGPLAYADARETAGIDLPQRFGSAPYQRLDAGQSQVRLVVPFAELGVSTANERWGPAIDSPFLLGTNAAGFEHLFLGLDSRRALGPVRLNARTIIGRLGQSDYSLAAYANRNRSIRGVIVVLQLRELPGLEFGGARIFEDIWPDSGVSLGDLISRTLRSSLILSPSSSFGGGDASNQIASLFARWVFPASSVEVYGELGREDNAYDARDLILEPDHDLAYMMGLRKIWHRADGSLLSVRGELLNSQISHLANVRLQAPPYVHDVVQQGHTQLGQVIGAVGAFGGGATVVAVDWLTSKGRRSITWRRFLTEPDRWQPEPPDVIQALTFEYLIFGPRIDLLPEATLAYNLNRDPGGNVLNLRLALSARAHW